MSVQISATHEFSDIKQSLAGAGLVLRSWATDKDESLVIQQRRLKRNVNTGRRKSRIIRTMVPKGRQCFKKKGGAKSVRHSQKFHEKATDGASWVKQQSHSDGWKLERHELGKRWGGE